MDGVNFNKNSLAYLLTLDWWREMKGDTRWHEGEREECTEKGRRESVRAVGEREREARGKERESEVGGRRGRERKVRRKKQRLGFA